MHFLKAVLQAIFIKKHFKEERKTLCFLHTFCAFDLKMLLEVVVQTPTVSCGHQVKGPPPPGNSF